MTELDIVQLLTEHQYRGSACSCGAQLAGPSFGAGGWRRHIAKLIFGLFTTDTV